MIYEVDFILIFDEVLFNLGLSDFSIKINNRKILSGIAEVCGEMDNIVTITVAIDKLDKIGKEGVIKELIEKNISTDAIEKIKPLFELKGSNEDILAKMKTYLAASPIGLEGVRELETVLSQVKALSLKKAKLEFDVTLARGLNYYTGAIFEVKVNNVQMGSICGGGRYDDLTGLFGMKDMSGVGISFGADRIYDVMNELNLFPSSLTKGVKVLFVNFGEKELEQCIKIAHQLRVNNISCDIYPSPAKLQKQMKYANETRVEYVALIGESEIASNEVTLKNMESGEQEKYSIEGLIKKMNE